MPSGTTHYVGCLATKNNSSKIMYSCNFIVKVYVTIAMVMVESVSDCLSSFPLWYSFLLGPV